MGDARARIFERLRAGASSSPPAADAPMRVFDWSQEERLARFEQALESVRGEVRRVGADWPRLLHERLGADGVGNLLYGPEGPYGAALEQGWPDSSAIALRPYRSPVDDWRDALFDRVEAGFTACRGAIAETGSLVLWPDAREPRLLSLVPPVHVVLLDVREIRSTLAELMADQRWSDGMPTNALLISGPSKSADIEQTLTYGVHGPATLIVLVRTDT